jgi:hypothetical protein
MTYEHQTKVQVMEPPRGGTLKVGIIDDPNGIYSSPFKLDTYVVHNGSIAVSVEHLGIRQSAVTELALTTDDASKFKKDQVAILYSSRASGTPIGVFSGR